MQGWTGETSDRLTDIPKNMTTFSQKIFLAHCFFDLLVYVQKELEKKKKGNNSEKKIVKKTFLDSHINMKISYPSFKVLGGTFEWFG